MPNHVFSQVPKISIPRSVFRRPHNIKTTIDTDYLYPIYVDEALPGDTFMFKGSLFGRLATPVVPLMDSLYLDTFFFAVPIRLVDKNFKKLMGDRPFGDTTTEYQNPMLNSGSTGVDWLSLSDYLGIPPKVPNLPFCAHWHRAYNLIVNEWFLDENLVAPRPIAGVEYDGTTHDESLSDYVLVRRGKRHDYFTSCLPFPQAGEPVQLNFGATAPVYGNGLALPLSDGSHGLELTGRTGGGANIGASTYIFQPSAQGSIGDTSGNSVGGYLSVDKKVGLMPKQGTSPMSGAYADLSTATPVSINALREAFALQRWSEVTARSGHRYIEILLGHFGVQSPDARMQRPEYLGGSSRPLQITTVAQTAPTNETSPQGNLAAFGTVSEDVAWSKSFTEHCVILGLANVRADLSYQQGLPRMFSRRTKYDYYWPELANLGEQAVLNKEIYAQGTSEDDGVFGYQERWAEYRYHPNMITGLFRSQHPQSLDIWHLAQKFESLPTLSSDFISEHVPIDRVVAVSDEPSVIIDGWMDIKCARPMPLYSVPSLSSRF